MSHVWSWDWGLAWGCASNTDRPPKPQHHLHHVHDIGQHAAMAAQLATSQPIHMLLVQDAAGNWVRNASAAALSAVLQPRAPIPQLPSVSADVHSINSLLWRMAFLPPSLPSNHPPGVPFPAQLSLAFGRAALLQQAVQLVPADSAQQGQSLAVQPLGPGNVSAGSAVQLLVTSAQPGQRLPAKLLACASGLSEA